METSGLPFYDAHGNFAGYRGVDRDITERKLAEQASKRAEKRLVHLSQQNELILSSVAEGILGLDLQGNHTFINTIAANMLGYKAEELLGSPSHSTWHHTKPDGNPYPREECPIYSTFRNGMVHRSSTEEFWRKDGTSFPVEYASTPIHEHGQLVGAVVTFSDITERKRAEEALRESETEFKTLFESASDGMFVYDLESRMFVMSNAACLRMLGFTPEEFLNMGLHDLHLPEDLLFISEQIRIILKGEEGFRADIRFKRRDGSTFFTDLNPTSILLGGRECVLITFRDITERKLADEKLLKSEEQFRLISENVADLIAVLDLEGRRVYTSPMYKNIIGDPNELRGTDSFQEIHPDDRENIKAIFKETVRTGIGQRTEYRFIEKDGTISNIESQGSVIRNKDGKVTNVVVVSRDVTKKKLLEQQFMRMQRMESIGTLAGGIAHDLNNVLAPIMLSIEILKKAMPDERSQRMLEAIETSAHRGAAIIKQILGFARGVQGEQAPIQFRHIINEITNIMKETFPKSITIKKDIPKNIWTIIGDPTNLHQLMMNLFINARDAMPDGGTIYIKTENKVIDEQYAKMNLEAKPGRYVMLSVEDTGCGIPPAVLKRIFEPFFTTKEVGKGTGLGLSTVHAIVKSHGGFVNVYSEVGKGTTFKIYLPAAEATDEIKPKLEESKEMLMGNGELIMVVEDESSIQQITKQALETYGYRVITASDGTEAVAHFASKKDEIALVLTDMLMPIMDGSQTIKVLRKMNPAVKIIASSGLASEGHVVTDKGLGVNAFIVKPYNAEKLLETIHSVLHKK
jgi:PAS domain S-box-containing protein